MLLKILRLITLLLAALALTMESAHVLELPQKMQYDPQMYTAVNGSLYKYFAVVGGAYQVGSIVASILLALAARHRRPAFGWTVSGAALLLSAFLVWLTVVEPVNRQVAAALQADPNMLPGLWTTLRDRWEYGHAAGFVMQLLGFAALVMSIVIETPRSVRPAFVGSR
jgi:hypothetical protein